MPYKRPIRNFKKYIPKFYSPVPSYPMSNAGSYSHDDSDFFGIPLPNEKEIQTFDAAKSQRGFSFTKIINYIRRHITIEEILLAGLIILLLDESFEDDLLLVILIYILLF
jgi:hypothetical protein